jgi:ATP-binding cassette, subfamily B, bacterial
VFLPGTVADNLRHVRSGASDAELLLALAQAGIEIGLERSLGAASTVLSRGERMRLALARAILLSPAILILDETTSTVDRELALSIMDSVDRVFADRTRVVITHDRRLAGEVDAVCMLRGGRVIQLPEEMAHAG